MISVVLRVTFCLLWLLTPPAFSAESFSRESANETPPFLPSNPIMRGADPHAIAVGNVIWVYPTWNEPGQQQFFAFSSTNLIDWQRQGPLLDFRNIPWIKEDDAPVHFAWAPSVFVTNGQFYFYYSVGPQNPKPARLGVAVGPSPSGPFTDSGHPLFTGGNGFEAIDPMVFHDSKSDKVLLYAGGSAGAKLRVFEMNPDLTSFAREIPVETPRNFTEAVFMHHHNGQYYLSYSHGVWRHSSYSVHYSTSDSPTGPWTYRGAILTSDSTRKGPGHHSFLQDPRDGQWLIFYHRWENQSGDGPYRGSRQLCVDRIEYDAAGLIRPVVMTSGARENPSVSTTSRKLPAGEARPRAEKELPVPGDAFLLDDRTAFVIPAKASSREKPWVWYAPTLPGLPGKEERWMFEQFLAAGISVAGIDVGESYGSPAGRKLFDAFHREMTARGYSARPILLGRSRGGLMTLSWAVDNPDKVGGFAGIYPVCNVASYPGISKAAPAYGMTSEELQSHLREHNPIDRLAALANARVPLFAIHGDVDTVVPLNENSGLLRDRYVAFGGAMQLIVPAGQGHNMWPGFFQCQTIVDFVKETAGPNLVLTSPLDYEVIQRNTREEGLLKIKGRIVSLPQEDIKIEGRLVTNGSPAPSEWQPLHVSTSEQTFEDRWSAPAGGWHRLEVRALSGTNIVAETSVEHVGIGEIFVIAGQSNSANHGAEKQTTKSGLVAAFDGQHWQPANDPQPGASGQGGSFIPPFGDAIAQHFRVPVGIVACGVGATSIREWLPWDSKFPNPPALTNHVQQLPDGTWQSQGDIYSAFVKRIELGPRGFRAVLWHQGESDANQADPTRTLPGNLYRDYLVNLIHASRHEIGWNAPWFVAQASYHNPSDQGSPDIRAAQASLWKDRIALEGPDTDSLPTELRDNDGQGVHFSGPGLREHAAQWFKKVAPWLETILRDESP